jgi:hypothetical protein
VACDLQSIDGSTTKRGEGFTASPFLIRNGMVGSYCVLFSFMVSLLRLKGFGGQAGVRYRLSGFTFFCFWLKAGNQTLQAAARRQ